jgi:hypothetical protein
MNDVTELTQALAVVVGYMVQWTVNDATIMKLTHHIKCNLWEGGYNGEKYSHKLKIFTKRKFKGLVAYQFIAACSHQ